MDTKTALAPLTRETATQKLRMPEDAWNARDPERVSLVYTEDTLWRNRVEFAKGLWAEGPMIIPVLAISGYGCRNSADHAR